MLADEKGNILEMVLVWLILNGALGHLYDTMRPRGNPAGVLQDDGKTVNILLWRGPHQHGAQPLFAQLIARKPMAIPWSLVRY
jgi:hypothetical protein